MIKMNSFKTAAAALVLLASVSAFAATNNSAVSNIAITATLPETLTVSLDQSAITFALVAGNATNAGNLPITATTSWALGAGRASVKLYAYFDTAAAALTGPVNIAGTTITATVGGVGAGNFAIDIASFLGSAGTGLPSPIFTQALTAGTLVGTHNSSVALNIDLTSLLALPVGTYTGTLHFMAVAI
jgi:hypothetical protein